MRMVVFGGTAVDPSKVSQLEVWHGGEVRLRVDAEWVNLGRKDIRDVISQLDIQIASGHLHSLRKIQEDSANLHKAQQA